MTTLNFSYLLKVKDKNDKTVYRIFANLLNSKQEMERILFFETENIVKAIDYSELIDKLYDNFVKTLNGIDTINNKHLDFKCFYNYAKQKINIDLVVFNY